MYVYLVIERRGRIVLVRDVHETCTAVRNQYQTSICDVNLLNEIEGTVIGTAIVGTIITGLIYIYNRSIDLSNK